ncbi:glyceraldehyde-3-phosphate dehydrogenase-like [Pteropus alecto]|uniref:glyceraldehyde-3-phosphate dehydrogenase-like n=1 Tax=Pteropus alecto TaxID=9402 RepID=UPI0007687B79|nr:glyceraldehyde-3-phosphate dehydrogenase-like [Pteropus alecto]
MALAITTTQKITDGPSGKLWCDDQRTAQIMIPATTGVAKLWVSTPNALVVDLTCHLEKVAKYDDIKKMVKQASENPLKGILGSTEDQVIACDFNNDTYSSTFKA